MTNESSPGIHTNAMVYYSTHFHEGYLFCAQSIVYFLFKIHFDEVYQTCYDDTTRRIYQEENEIVIATCLSSITTNDG